MKNVYAAIIAACLGGLGSSMVQAQNTAYGLEALSNNSGSSNAAFGVYALGVANSGNYNTAIGIDALKFNTTGSYNTATGTWALGGVNTGDGNTATGYYALTNNTTGFHNSATGYYALYNNSTGTHNTAFGDHALYGNSSGSENIAIGYGSGQNITTGSHNIDFENSGTASDNGVIRIGIEGTYTSFYAAGITGVQVSGGIPVYINSNGQLGTVNSSIRFKEDIHDMADASSKIFRLRPVTYRYRQAYADGSKPVDYGLIAEEVAQVYPDMVVHDASGQILTVQYQKLTPMLLNEVQKEHHQLEAQQQTIDMLEQRLSKLENKLEAAMTSGNNTIAMIGK